MALNRSVFAVAFMLVAGSIRADEADLAKQDIEALQGTWRLDEEESLFFHTEWVDTGRFPHFDEFVRSKTIEIKKDKLRYGEKLQHEIAIVLGTEAGKKTIRFTSGDKAPIVAIYELEEGACRICAVDPEIGGGKAEARLPKTCRRTRLGWFAQFNRAKP